MAAEGPRWSARPAGQCDTTRKRLMPLWLMLSEPMAQATRERYQKTERKIQESTIRDVVKAGSLRILVYTVQDVVKAVGDKTKPTPGCK